MTWGNAREIEVLSRTDRNNNSASYVDSFSRLGSAGLVYSGAVNQRNTRPSMRFASGVFELLNSNWAHSGSQVNNADQNLEAYQHMG